MSDEHRFRGRVLVVGASGQVGRALCAAFGDSAIPASCRHPEPGHRHVDLADPESLRRVWREVKPDVVLLAGGMCNVDGCEREPDRCRQINVGGTQAVVGEAVAFGARVVFFSTDHVFDGSSAAHGEADAVAPMNVYSESKVHAEAVIRERLPGHHLIIRTSWVYGVDHQRRNFVIRLIDRLRKRQSVIVPEDQWGSPTWTEDLARATRALVEQGEHGTFHASGPDFLSRTELASRICACFDLDSALIVASSTDALDQAARRPLRVRLDCSRLADAGVGAFSEIDAGLNALRASLERAGDQP